MIKGIIYDLDDVMVNSYGLHVKATGLVLSEQGVQLDQKTLSEKLKSKLLGRRVIEVIRILVSHFKLKIDPKALFQRREEIFLRLAREELGLMPGVKESLNLFRNEGYKTAVASSGTKELINLVLEKFGLFHLFEEIVTAEDVRKGKPDPEVFSVAVKKLVFKPEECVVFEDATNGIKAAKKAGCKCIAIKNPHVPEQDLSKADVVVNSLNAVGLLMIRKL